MSRIDSELKFVPGAQPEADRSPIGSVKLQWVIVDGKQRNVAEFAGIEPKYRPDATCPLCQRPVILRLGEVRAHHAAHRPGVVCAATQPETAMHLNAKIHLKQQLEGASELFVVQKCAGWHVEGKYNVEGHSCDVTRSINVARDWQVVELEKSIAPYRADVALLNNDQVILAIEVRVSHKVDENKGQALKGLGVPWIELAVDEAFCSGETAWTPDRPLEPIAASFPQQFRAWRCPDCTKTLADAEYRRSVREKVVAPKAAGRRKPHNLVRFVDIYYPSGKRYREIFSLTRFYDADQKPNSAILQKGDYKKASPETLARAKPPIDDAAINYLKQAFEKDLADMRKQGWVVDSPMDWREWPSGLGRNDVFFEDIWFPPRYVLQDSRWILNESYKNLQWSDYWQDETHYRKELRQTKNNSPGSEKPQRVVKQVDKKEGSTTVKQDYPVGYPAPKPAICIFCGQLTTDYWHYDGQGNCQCRTCYREGKYQ